MKPILWQPTARNSTQPCSPELRLASQSAPRRRPRSIGSQVPDGSGNAHRHSPRRLRTKSCGRSPCGWDCSNETSARQRGPARQQVGSPLQRRDGARAHRPKRGCDWSRSLLRQVSWMVTVPVTGISLMRSMTPTFRKLSVVSSTSSPSRTFSWTDATTACGRRTMRAAQPISVSVS